MLRKLVIRNFQCHERLELTLDEHITTIVGPSDAGKSAVLRALRWLVQNRPSGAAFLRDGAERVSATLHVDEHKVTRAREGDENTYRVDDAVYSAVGKDVPAEVTAILNLDDVNFQWQHDGPFWFDLSPPEVSRRLNSIVDLSLIDTTLANIAAGVRKARAERAVVEERLTAARAEREALRPAKEAHADLQAAEAAAEERVAAEKRTVAVAALMAAARASLGAMEGLAAALEAGKRALGAGKDWADVQKRAEALTDITAAAGKYKRAAAAPVPDLSGVEAAAFAAAAEIAKMVALGALLAEVRGQERMAAAPVPDLSGVEAAAGAAAEARRRAAALVALLGEAGKHREAMQFLTDSLGKNKLELREKMGDTCALCGQKIRS